MEKESYEKKLDHHVYISMADVHLGHQSHELECQSILRKGSPAAIAFFPG